MVLSAIRRAMTGIALDRVPGAAQLSLMARQCDISGKKTSSGNTISHSHRKTRRKFKVNLFEKKVYLPDENRTVRLRVSARMLKSLSHKGVKTLMKKYGQDLSALKPPK